MLDGSFWFSYWLECTRIEKSVKMEVDRGKILAIDDNKEILLSLRVALAKHFDEVKIHTFPDN